MARLAHLRQLGLAGGQLALGQAGMPGHSQLTQQRQARLQVTDGVPWLSQAQITVCDLEQAQGVRALRSLLPESLRRLLVSVDGRLVVAEAPSFGKPIIQYDVSSLGAQSYVSAAKELLSRYSVVIPPTTTSECFT